MSKKLVPVSSNIPEALRRELEREAQWRHRSMSELIRQALEEYLTRNRHR